MASTYEMSNTERYEELFITGLKNAHALEKQALSIMEPQVSRIQNYPEMADRLRLHIDETNQQIMRLDEILEGFDSKASALKDMATSMAGGAAAIGHSIMGDEVLKNSFANYAFEHFEIASYKSLIMMAEDGSFQRAIPLLQTSLREEQMMAEWIDQHLPTVTRRYAEIYVREGASEAKI